MSSGTTHRGTAIGFERNMSSCQLEQLCSKYGYCKYIFINSMYISRKRPLCNFLPISELKNLKRNEFFLVFIGVQFEIVDQSSLEAVNRTWVVLFRVIDQQWIVVLQILRESFHPLTKVILKEFRQILIIKRKEDTTHQQERFKQHFQSHWVVRACIHSLTSLDKGSQQRFLNNFQGTRSGSKLVHFSE